MNEELRKVIEYLRNVPAQFCIIYQEEIEGNLEVYETIPIEPITPEELEKLGAEFLIIATECYGQKEVKRLASIFPKKASPKKPLPKYDDVEPVNRVRQFEEARAIKEQLRAIERCWRTLIVGPIHIRKIGYVVVARILAHDWEVRSHTARIKSICSQEPHLMTLKRILFKFMRVLVTWARRRFRQT